MTVMPNIVINTSNISKGQSKAVTARITHWIMRFIGHLSKVAAGRTLQPATRDRCRCRVRLHRQWAGLRDGLWRDRKSVVSGKGVSVSVDLGGRRIIKTKKEKT